MKKNQYLLHKLGRTLNAFVPYLFAKEPIPEISNPDFVECIERLRRQPTQLTAMQLGLEILSEKFESRRFKSLLYVNRAFEHDPNMLWYRKGFMHCTQQNELLRILLVKSGQVRDVDIRLGYSLVWYISIHQFLIVKVRDKNAVREVALDPWNYGLGASLGKYATGFGMATWE